METAHINIHGQIGNDEWMPDPNDAGVVTYAKVFAQVIAAKDAGAKAFVFDINSFGGYVEEAFAIANLIEKLPNTTAVAKLVASAANIVYAACKQKSVSEASRFMLHPAWVSDVYGNADELIAVAESLKSTDAKIDEYLAQKLGIDISVLNDFVAGKETWFGASEAQAIGYTNERKELTAIQAKYMKQFLNKIKSAAFKAMHYKAMTIQLKDGGEIYVDAEEGGAMAGAETDAPDGTHELADGTKIVVAGGVITEVEAPEGLATESSAASMDDALKAENEQLKAKLAEAEAKLQEMAAEASKAEETALAAIASLGKEVEKLKGQIQSNAKPPKRTAEVDDRKPVQNESVAARKMQEARIKAGIEKAQ